MSAISVRHVPASTILAGDVEPLLKATKLIQKWIPAYTKHDGTFVAAHHKMVHQADDHDDAKVLAGQGSYSQKMAHKQLTKHDWFNQLPDEHKVPILQQHATDIQAADSAKAQLAVMKVDVLAGKAPKPAALKLFAALPEAQAAAIVADLKEKGADPTLLLSVMNAHPAAPANKAPAPPAPAPAAVPEPAPAPDPAPATAPSPSPSPSPSPAAAAAAEAGPVLAHEVEVGHWSVYTNTAGAHNKFWAAAVVPLPDGSALFVSRYGPIGSKGQSTTKHLPSVSAAFALKSVMVSQKKGNGYSTGDASDHPALKAPVTLPVFAKVPAAAAAPAGVEPADGWQKVGGQLGSNSGFVAVDPQGQKWYVKTPNSEAHAQSEMTAAKLYALAGVKAAQLKPVTVGGKLSIASKWEDGTSKASAATLMGAGARDGFAVDAWLANWDAMGVDSTNIQVVGHHASRIDVGGSLEFRAQGAPKGAAFGTSVGELATLRDPTKNAQTAAVFGSMSDLDVAKSIDATVAKVTPEQIAEATGGDKALAEKLVKRREYLMGWASTHLAKPPAAAPAPAPADEGPKEGETKEGADGQLVFKNGRWHKVAEIVQAAAPAPALPMPEFTNGTVPLDPGKPGPKDYYEKIAAKVIAAVQSGDVKALEDMKANAGAGKSWAGKTPNSKKLLALHAQALALVKKPAAAAPKPNRVVSAGLKPVPPSVPLSPGMKAAVEKTVENNTLETLQDLVDGDNVNPHAKAYMQELIAAKKAATAPAPRAPKVVAAAPTPVDKFAKLNAIGAALDAIHGAALPATNTNSVPHNKKLQQLLDHAKTGDLAALQAMTFGSNTYGKKQAKLAAQLIAAMSGAPAAAAAPAPKFEQAWPPAPPAPKEVVAAAPKPPEKPKLDPTALPVNPDLLPPLPAFKGSSKAHVNESNAADAAKILAFAKTGNLVALKQYKYAAIDKETGASKGEQPIASHPSQQVKGFYDDLVQYLDTIANPPAPLDVSSSLSSSVKELSDSFKPHQYGVAIGDVPASQRLGFWIALGKESSWEKFKPKLKVPFGNAFKMAAQAAHAAYKSTVKKWISGVQGSGSYNQPYRDGLEKDYGGASTRETLLALYKAAKPAPAGSTIYKWIQMPDTMVQQFMGQEPGLVFQNPGSMCCSMSESSTSHFGQHRMVIHYAEGAAGITAFGSGSFAGEQEITTLPGARFMVLGRKMMPGAGGKPRLELEVLMLPPDQTYVDTILTGKKLHG